MTKLLTKLIFAFFIVGCNSQNNDSVRIIGDWGLLSNSVSESFNYQEVFFDEELMHRHNYIGDLPSLKYLVENDTLLISDFATGEKGKVGKIEISEDSLRIISDKGLIVYKRIKNDKDLSTYIQGKIDYDTYRKAFYERKGSR